MSDFKKIANHLLDLGKRNRLLNFKDSGMRSINILNKEIKDIYRNIIDSKEYTILLIDSLLERHKNDLVIEGEQYDILSYPSSRVYDIITPILKSKQLLCYKKGSQQIKVLKALYKEYNFSLNEKGINSLYMAFGFINYSEDKTKFKAPILLIPLKYTKTATAYTVKEAEDEVILNPTLEYYFKQQYGIEIPNIVSQDQDLLEYFETIKTTLPESMFITEEAAIGIFSFQKMNMYNDLVGNEEQVTKNKNIRALMGEYIEGVNVYPDSKPYPVVNCDSSQLEAIKLGVSGQSFVLQGPPGSGKSQTITNIIASLVANERKVLFVSEKLAALQVVYENLKRAGLSEFAIELHSSKANKKEFIDDLYKTAMLPKYNIESTLEIDITTYNGVKEYLDQYIKVLHTPVEEGFTLFDLISEYSKTDIETIKHRILHIEDYSLAELRKIEGSFYDYAATIKKIGYDYRILPFNGLIDSSLEYITYEIEDDLVQSIKYLKKLIELSATINKYIKSSKDIKSVEDFRNVFDFIDIANQLIYKDDVYFLPSDRITLINEIIKYEELEKNLPDISNYDREILNTNVEVDYFYMKGCTSVFTRLFDKKYKQTKRTILAYRNGKAKHDVIIDELNRINKYKKDTKEMKTTLDKINSYFSHVVHIAEIKKDLEISKDCLGYNLDFKYINKLVDCVISYKNYGKEEIIFNKLAGKFDLSILNFNTYSVEVLLNRLTEIYDNKDKLRDYSLVKSAVKEIEDSNQLEFLHAFLQLGLDINLLSTNFKKVYLKNKILYYFEKYPILGRFNSDQFDKKVEDFIELDEKMLTINRDIIISKNSKKRPDDVLSSATPFGILTHEYNKVKRKKPIRKLLDEIFRFALDIKPVFLMSPLSVSTYLSSEPDIFDCVIFDEASQIFAWDALGSIYRAKQCIIIGDSKQMPPTNFFNASVEVEEDIEENDIELESILDMASNCFITSNLRWHYRSRSEELITFSNKNFYDNTLITIPQAKAHNVGFGIDFIYLPDGRYDAKSRTNIIEARKICDMVIEHYQSSELSLGVVAFSKVQAELIEEMIEKRIADYPELSKYFSNEIEEPFFVKNLETVQGDERDRIIFSICYGYNMDGKFYHRFGPLNNTGGERRLNVAITRAKYNISVVSSIRYVDIKSTESLGSKLLREYLKFSESVETEKRYTESENGLIISIKDFIEKKGYEVLTNYGTSSFKIPLAVKKKGEKDFLAAVMLDSKDSLQKNTTDSNRLEQLLIRRLGWKYYKIYAPEWFNYNERTKEDLYKFLTTCENEEVKKEVKEDVSYLDETVKKTEITSVFMDYYFISIEELQQDIEDQSIEYVINKIITAEQPITYNYLCKKVAAVMNSRSVTNAIKKLVTNNIPEDVIEKNGVYWKKYEEISPLRINSDRHVDDVPIEELMDGILNILKYVTSMPKRNCYKKLIEILGHDRVTETTKHRLDDAVIFLQLEGKIIVKDDILSI